MLQKKEVMASKMLKPEDLEKFQTIKKQLVNALVLQVTAGFGQALPELTFMIENCLFRKQPDTILLIANADQAMELAILDPAVAFSKQLDFAFYFQKLQQDEALKSKVFNTVSVKMLSPSSIQRYSALIDKTVKKTVNKQPSVLTSEDVDKIRDLVVSALRNEADASTKTAYFESLQELIIRQGASNQELRALLFDQLLKRNTPGSLWKIFTQAVATKDASSLDFEAHCIKQLKINLRRLIQNANRDLQSVEDFSHLTTLISQFTGLDKQRQVSLL